MILDAVRDLYRARWGEPSRRANFDVAGTEIEVFKWDSGANPEGVALYATIGASGVPLAGRNLAHRVEFFVGLLPEKDEVAKPLAMLASYSAREGTALDHGHTVTFPEPLWIGTGLRAFLVMRPLSDVLSALRLVDGTHVEFLQAIPLFPSEVTFKEAKGAQALMSRWERSSVPFWDPARSSDP